MAARSCKITVPPNLLPTLAGNLRAPAAIGRQALRRHSRTLFHTSCAKQFLKSNCGAHPSAPSKECFRTVLRFVKNQGGAPSYRGIDGVGAGDKVRDMIYCLGESSLRIDQKFFKRVQSISILRDARKTRLCVRFNAVTANSETRRGILGQHTGLLFSLLLALLVDTILSKASAHLGL